MVRNIWMIGLCGLSLMGCSMTPSKPDFDQLPVVTFGEPIPKDKDYILYFPANAPISTNVSIEGNLLQKPAKDELTVKLNKDIYTYKNWVSFDKQNWVISRDVINVRAVVKIPGTRHPKPGVIQVSINEKQKQDN
jgi:hypothetical protein